MFAAYETYLKIAVILLYTAFIWYCHGVYDNAKLAKIEEKQVIQAQTGETKQIEYQQIIQKVYVKDQCSDVPIPAAALRMLK